jgi:hypothetical protein
MQHEASSATLMTTSKRGTRVALYTPMSRPEFGEHFFLNDAQYLVLKTTQHQASLKRSRKIRSDPDSLKTLDSAQIFLMIA